MYADEVIAGQRKVSAMREAKADAHDVTQQVRGRYDKVARSSRVFLHISISTSRVVVGKLTSSTRFASRAGKRFERERDDGSGQLDAIRASVRFVDLDKRALFARWVGATERGV